MAHHKGGSSDTDAHTDEQQITGAVHKSSQRGRNTSEEKNGSHHDTRSVLVTQRSVDEAHENSRSNTGDTGVPNLLLGKAEVILNLTQKGGGRELNEESDEETPPRTMESAHVGALEGQELDLRGFIILIGIDIDEVFVVLLPIANLKI